MARIAIDCRFWGVKSTGLGRYTKNLVLNLLKLDSKNQYLLLVSPKFATRIKTQLKGFKNFKPLLIKAKHYSLKEQLEVPRVLNQAQPDLTHFVHFNVSWLYSKKYLVTIHDMIKHFYKGKDTTTRPRPTYWLKHLGYQLVFKKAVKTAQKIITPSRFVKTQLKNYFKIPDSKISAIYQGVDQAFLKPANLADRNWFANLAIKNRFLVYVGNLYPHKNVNTLLKALKKVNQDYFKTEPLSLVIVSGKGVFLKRLKSKIDDLKLQKIVKHLCEVSDRRLNLLLKSSLGLVMPSLMEGFGLPGVEAMTSGALVLSAQGSCLPEVYGANAIYFDPQDVNDLALKIKQLANIKPSVKKKMIKKSQEWAKRYQWQKTAQKTLEIYQKMVLK